MLRDATVVWASILVVAIIVVQASGRPLDEPVPPPPKRIHELQMALKHHEGQHTHFQAQRIDEQTMGSDEEASSEDEESARQEALLRSALRANQGCRNLHHENLKLRTEVLKLKRENRRLHHKVNTEVDRVHAVEENRHELKREMDAFTHTGGSLPHPTKAHAGLLAHQRSLLRRRLENAESADSSVDSSSDASADSSADGQFPIVGTMAGLYTRFASEFPTFGGVAKATETDTLKTESKDAVHAAVMEADLQRTREDLGKAEEEKQHLQDRVSDLESTDADKDSDIAKLKETTSSEEADIAKLKAELQTSTVDNEAAKQANMTHKYQEQLEAQEVSAQRAQATLNAELNQKEAAAKELSARLRSQEGESKKLSEERGKLTEELHRELTGEGKFAAERFETERRKEEETLKSEAKELQSMEGEEGKCMAWGKRLEVRMQRVLKNRQNDARLCRDGILSLHEERGKLKKALQKKEAEFQVSKKAQADAEASSTEDQGLLSKCLEEVSTMHT